MSPVYWIVIDRDGYGEDIKPIAFGPYLSEEAVIKAEMHAMLIDAQCEKNCLDLWIEPTHPEASPTDVELVIIDPRDPYHTGVAPAA